jgi:hypothetical protein
LLHWGDKVTNTWYDKPLVSNFTSYLSTTGQQVQSTTLTQPSNYFDPYDIAANCTSCVTSGVQGKLIDQKGNDIKNAVVKGTSWKWTDDNVLIGDPSDDLYYHDVSYTFTHQDGTFIVYPYNYFQLGIANPHRIVSLEVSAVGAEKRSFGAGWPYGDQPMVSNINTQSLKKIINGYDAVVSNETVNVDEERNYYGRNSLTANAMNLNGKSNLTSRNEIHINSEFHAHASIGAINNETHIFISDAFPDCPVDFINYLRVSNPTANNESENTNSKDIEIKFNIIKNLTVDIAPNPTNGIVNFFIQNPLQGNIRIEILNLIGEIIWSGQTSQNNYSVNLENLSKGIYMIHFSNEQQVITKKLIIN